LQFIHSFQVQKSRHVDSVMEWTKDYTM